MEGNWEHPFKESRSDPRTGQAFCWALPARGRFNSSFCFEHFGKLLRQILHAKPCSLSIFLPFNLFTAITLRSEIPFSRAVSWVVYIRDCERLGTTFPLLFFLTVSRGGPWVTHRKESFHWGTQGCHTGHYFKRKIRIVSLGPNMPHRAGKASLGLEGPGKGSNEKQYYF